ncbi:MAG TPA: hypothetical protein PLO59_00190 [Bacteroidia bacterium]|nr:hypothetical protein [Bacteroidia bacterium]HQU99536.1 hypothetical protein [Bacteroidia bacterium]
MPTGTHTTPPIAILYTPGQQTTQPLPTKSSMKNNIRSTSATILQNQCYRQVWVN